MELGGGLGHLTYSTLVHPGDTWDEMWASLTRYVPAVKKRVSPDKPFGVSLRLSAKSTERLTREPDQRAKLKSFLADNGMYLFTVNAFPYGPFKGERVKELVYEPDWRTDERAEYTMKVADILAEVALAGISPSIQSPPCGFKPRVTGRDVVDAYTRQILRVVAHLIALEARTGRTVTLALEPEPLCFMELTSEAIAYFKDHLYSTSWSAWKVRSFGTLMVDGAEARFTSKKRDPVLITNVFRVTSGWRNQTFGEPIIPALDTWVEVLYGDPKQPSVAFVNDGRLWGLASYYRSSGLRSALRALLRPPP